MIESLKFIGKSIAMGAFSGACGSLGRVAQQEKREILSINRSRFQFVTKILDCAVATTTGKLNKENEFCVLAGSEMLAGFAVGGMIGLASGVAYVILNSRRHTAHG